MGYDVEAGLTRFLTAAQSFCAVVDSANGLSAEAFISAVGGCLLQLYGSALWFPRIEPDSSDIADIPFPEKESPSLRANLEAKLDKFNLYWEVFDSTAQEAPVQSSLGGDISEIYFDMKHDLELAGRNASRADVLWELRESFLQHWGRHAMSALKAIHDLRSNEVIG